MRVARLHAPSRARLGALSAVALCLLAGPARSGEEAWHPTGVAVVTRLAAPEIIRIPAGTFLAGSDFDERLRARALCVEELGPSPSPLVVHQCLGDGGGCGLTAFLTEEPARTLWLHAFSIDRTEVTVGRYGRCVRAGPCREGMVREGDPQYGHPEQPVVGVSWDDAARFCAWARGRLPTSMEWERAARGRDGRAFPWGMQADGARANHGMLSLGCLDDADGSALTARVGSFPDGASQDGLQDMAGNVSEWVADRFEIAGVGVVSDNERTLRGGSFRAARHALRCAWRGHSPAGQRALDVGFRCAYDAGSP